MSGIIWGIINFNNEEVSEELGKSMIKKVSHFVHVSNPLFCVEGKT